MYERTRRPLRRSEIRLLQSRADRLAREDRRAVRAVLPLAIGATVALWAWTLVASDAPWPVVTLFWGVVGAGLIAWLRHDLSKSRMGPTIQRLRSALQRNEAEEHAIRAVAFAELEEVEDEGACYAFQVDGDRIVFVCGQEFYPGARFPSLDFSVVYPLAEDGGPADMWVEKRGPKTAAARTIPGWRKWELAVPQHLEIRRGSIERIESDLAGSSADGTV